VDVWAWTADEPTRLLTGSTLELGTEGALLRLPKLPADVMRFTLRICLTERATLTSATVSRQQPPDIVEVEFDSIDPYERGRIRTFIDTAG
jgi:hypothetical protein